MYCIGMLLLLGHRQLGPWWWILGLCWWHIFKPV